MSKRLQDALVWTITVTVLLVALFCAPGLTEEATRLLPPAFRFGWLIYGISDAVTLPKMLVTWTLAPLLVALAAAVVLSRGRSGGGRACFVGLAIGYVAWTSLANARGLWPALGWESVVTLAAIALATAAVAVALDAAGAMRVLSLLALPAMCVSLYSICQHVSFDFLGWDPRHSEPDRSIATFGNPDFFATWLVAIAPVAVWRTTASASWRSRAGWGALTGVLVVTIVFSYTRAAWLALALEAVVIAAWCRPRLSREGTGAFVVTVAVLSLLLWMQPSRQSMSIMGRLADTVRGDQSTSVRLVLWREALMVAAAHPLLGTGTDSFSYAAMPYRAVEPPYLLARVGMPGDPHNAFLEVLTSAGVPALALLLAWIAVSASAALAAAAGGGAGHEAARYAAVCLLGFWVGHLLVHSTVPSTWLAFLLAALCISLRDDSSGQVVSDTPPRSSRGAAAIGSLIVGLASSVGVALWAAPIASADYTYNLAAGQGMHALKIGGVEGAHYLRSALQHYGEALGESTGVRQGRIAGSRARVLEGLMARIPPDQARGTQRTDWVGLREQATRSALLALDRLFIDPYLWHDLARLLMIASEGAQDPRERDTFRLKAVEASRQGCSLDPFNAALMADLARRLAQCEQYAEAEPLFRRSLDLAPQQVAVRLDLGRMLAAWGRQDAAVQVLREVVRQDPGNADAVKILSELSQRPSERHHE